MKSRSKIKDGVILAAKYASAIVTTIVSALVAVIMYVLYLPFGIGRAMFNRSDIRAFYTDFFDVCEIIGGVLVYRKLKREE